MGWLLNGARLVASIVALVGIVALTVAQHHQRPHSRDRARAWNRLHWWRRPPMSESGPHEDSEAQARSRDQKRSGDKGGNEIYGDKGGNRS